VVVAHPDDETEVNGYLARAIFDGHKRVAVIFGTHGDGGAMPQARNRRLRSVQNGGSRRAALSPCWASPISGSWVDPIPRARMCCARWKPGTSLEQVVRLIRLTRPELILTWLPDYVAGENHGDHQAAGVIATEAFDLAGDPTAFPEQVAAPRDRNNIGNLTEGLHPWQTKKLYYFSNASNPGFQSGKGPRYSTEDDSPSKKEPYYRIAAEEMSFHLTQDDTGQVAVAAMQKGDYSYFRQPVLLITGKSLVQSSITGDIFDGIGSDQISFSAPPGYKPTERTGIWIELGGPWSFYREFWQKHGLTHLPGLLTEVGVNVLPGERIQIPLLINNRSDTEATVAITPRVPATWTEAKGGGAYVVPAHQTVPHTSQRKSQRRKAGKPRTSLSMRMRREQPSPPLI
jgi:LmbE family N-acetylglucosaminyl deacetylase